MFFTYHRTHPSVIHFYRDGWFMKATSEDLTCHLCKISLSQLLQHRGGEYARKKASFFPISKPAGLQMYIITTYVYIPYTMLYMVSTLSYAPFTSKQCRTVGRILQFWPQLQIVQKLCHNTQYAFGCHSQLMAPQMWLADMHFKFKSDKCSVQKQYEESSHQH